MHHVRQYLQIAETRRAHVNAIRLGGAVADHVVADLAARRFDHLVDLAGGHAEAFGHDLEMIDQRFHLRLHLFARRQNHLRRFSLPSAAGHSGECLFDDFAAFPQLFHAHAIPGPHIVAGHGGNAEVEFFVTGIGLALADVPGHSGGADHGAGDAHIQHGFQRHKANALGAANPDRVAVQQTFVLVHIFIETVDEFADGFVPAARRFQGESADAEITGHHPLAGEHLEDAEDVFAFAEAVEEHGHRADIERVRAQPHQMAVDAGQLGEHHAHPLRLRGDLHAEQLLHREHIDEIVREVGEVIHAVRKRDHLLVGLHLALLFDAGVKVADIGLRCNNGFAVEFEQNAQDTVRRRVLRTHVEGHQFVVWRALIGLRFDFRL